MVFDYQKAIAGRIHYNQRGGALTMKRKPVWILAAIVAGLLASSLLWNYSMQAAGPARRGPQGRVADISDKDFFDIRNKESKAAASEFERRMEKLAPRQKEKSDSIKQSMKAAKEEKARSAPEMEVALGSLTNSPAVVDMNGKGRKFLTPSSKQPRESVVKGFIKEHADVFGMSP